ncbi:phosphoribosylanthranilate isomerase [Flavobacterium sp.]|uniref:phosphoribosylanthranilate isomerase n=1 Tax=Flavobacterium sp. TaxID=239 RepID=UPI003751C376
MKVKICGMFFLDNIYKISALNPDFMGFIFYPKSKRYVGNDFSFEMIKDVPKTINKVAVFVNESIEKVLKIHESFDFDFVQLHGEESVDYCKEIKQSNIKIIKAFQIDEKLDFSNLKEYESSCEYFLFDTKSDNYGGSGRSFNWQLLLNYKLQTPFFISGGLGLQNIVQILEFKHPKFEVIDFNSQIEDDNYIKNIEKTTELLLKIKNNE